MYPDVGIDHPIHKTVPIVRASIASLMSNEYSITRLSAPLMDRLSCGDAHAGREFRRRIRPARPPG
jgi:hypothetical protein